MDFQKYATFGVIINGFRKDDGFPFSGQGGSLPDLRPREGQYHFLARGAQKGLLRRRLRFRYILGKYKKMLKKNPLKAFSF